MAKKEETKGKKEVKKKGAYHVYKLYDVSGSSLKRKSPTCPKCGPGTFMAQHMDRTSCGKCGYSEFKKKVKI